MQFDVYKCFVPECFLDTALVEVLLGRQNVVNHKKGNSTVVKMMLNEKMKDQFLVAVIDDDKVKVAGLEQFEEVSKLRRDGIKLFRREDRQHYIIQVSPAIERWIIRECQKGGIDIAEFEIPGELDGLRKMKGLSQRSDPKFVKLFKHMLGNENCDEIKELQRWLQFFKENTYKSKLELLLNG